MKHISNLTLSLFAAAFLLLVGCGGGESLAPVSGKVTADGQPLAGVRVVFNPLATSDNLNPGTWSSGLTDAQGEFTLVNRNKKNGAAICTHAVTFEYDDLDADAMEELEEDMEEAQEEGLKADYDAAKKELEELKKMAKNRPKFSEDFEIQFVVPKGGTTEANFDVSATSNK